MQCEPFARQQILNTLDSLHDIGITGSGMLASASGADGRMSGQTLDMVSLLWQVDKRHLLNQAFMGIPDSGGNCKSWQFTELKGGIEE